MRFKLYMIFLLSLASLFSQTQVSGNINGIWEASGSPYQLTANAVIVIGDSLRIEPGVQVDLGDGFEFRVQGYLFALNTTFFNGDQVRGDNGELILRFCAFMDIDRGVYLNSGRAQFQNCLIEASGASGISFSNVDTSFVRNSQILNNGDYGIKILQSDDVEISGNLLVGNSTNDTNHPALFIDSCSPQIIENNTILNNHGQGVGIWTLTSVAAPIIRNNLIKGNFTGITIVSSPANILDNIIVANYQEGNFNSGAGIYAGYSSSAGIILGNYIGGNYYGVSIINFAVPNLGDMVNDYPGDDGLNLFYDNSYNGETCHIWNGTSSTIMAQNNFWLGMDLSEVDATLYDNEEGGGEILFEPIYAAPLPEPPDINDDGHVNILDVVVLIEGIVGRDVPDPLTFYLSDINHDFENNAADITVLIEIVVQ